MKVRATKSRDARLNLWAGIGVTACFAVASLMLISGLGGRPIDASSADKQIAGMKFTR